MQSERAAVALPSSPASLARLRALRLPRGALPLLAMALGHALAGVGLLQQAPPWLTRVPPGYVALVNQHGILMSDYISQTATELEEPFTQATAAQRAQVLREMIDRELLVQRALALDLPETTIEVRSAMADAVRERAEADAVTEPTEDQLRAYYEAHRDKYASEGSMMLRDLVLPLGGSGVAQAETAATEAAYELRSGANIAEVSDRFGLLDLDAEPMGPQPDYQVRKRLGPQLFHVAETLAAGDVSGPIVAADGVHLLVMQERLAPQIKDFAAARPEVYNDYQLATKQQAVDQELARLRRQAKIVLAPGMSE
jgi:peptidyl-prolyl cis-trans isomerase C